jgi:hypothetical protein
LDRLQTRHLNHLFSAIVAWSTKWPWYAGEKSQYRRVMNEKTETKTWVRV